MKFEIDFIESYSDENIIRELQRLATALGKNTLSLSDINVHGRISPPVLYSRYGSLSHALLEAGLKPRPCIFTNRELCFFLTEVWTQSLKAHGRSPTRQDLITFRCPASANTFSKRFGSWNKALLAAAEFLPIAADSKPASPPPPSTPAPRRKPVSIRKRFFVLKRDRYRCCLCKRSGVELEVDHKIPVSQGGSSALHNLQTLCVDCNQGKWNSRNKPAPSPRDIMETVNASLLINALGHSAGVLIFGIFLVLLIQDRATRRLRGGFKSVLAAALALAWNLASLIVLGLDDPNTAFAKITIAIGFGVLSLLPAVLFDLCLFDPSWDPRYRVLVRIGYALSIAATALHVAELFQQKGPYHGWGLALITAGFGVSTVIAALRVWREQRRRTPHARLTRPAGRLVGTMSLLLLAMSFVHLGGEHAQLVWSHELAFHHAAIPLALLILLQDYRFLLLDAFLRFLANVFLAALFVSAAALAWREGWLTGAATPVHLALLLAGATMALIAYALLRTWVQRLLTRVVFRRPDSEALLADLKIAVRNEDEYLASVSARLSEFMGAEANFADIPHAPLDPGRPVLVSELPALRADLEQRGAEAIVPITVRPGVARYLLLGRRTGGRRYLSEDLEALARASAVVADQLEQHRDSEMRRLVAQAELRALQSQIHPHFLFNALNTLFGIIPREARGARETVLNLADIFRYFLETKKTLLPLEEELHIVKAYLEVERLRLGQKLDVEIEVTPEALAVSIPILSIQPLVENAVKHGIAPVVGQGLVRIQAHIEDGSLHVVVSDSGPGFGDQQGTGVGLENVSRRLELSYGTAARVEIRPSPPGRTEVRFTIPAAARPVEVLR